jgi:hypothetical protein
MNLATHKDVGSFVATRGGIAGTTVDSEVNTGWVDRQGFMSAVLALSGQAVLADAETLSFQGNWQDADDAAGSGAADYGDPVSNVVIQTGLTGQTEAPISLERGLGRLKANLDHARRYIRAQFTLSTSGSGTATYGAAIVLGGADQNPPL